MLHMWWAVWFRMMYNWRKVMTGNQVAFSAPVPDDKAVPAGRPSAETEFIRRTSPPVSGRVLIMDEDKSLLEVAVLLLETIGVEVVPAGHGQDAIRCFQFAKSIGKPFDLVILDMSVSRGQGGGETLRQIRMADTGVKVILSTGYSNAPELARCWQHGFNGCLTKPYRGADLLGLAFKNLPRRQAPPVFAP